MTLHSIGGESIAAHANFDRSGISFAGAEGVSKTWGARQGFSRGEGREVGDGEKEGGGGVLIRERTHLSLHVQAATSQRLIEANNRAAQLLDGR